MITNLVQIAAYKALALQLMIGEADQLTRELGLPVQHPIQMQQLADAFVGPPLYGVAGSIQTTNLAVTFSGGQFHTLTRIDIYPPLKMSPATIKKLPPTANISAGEAYQLATQWLTSISMDVASLEKHYPPKISQQVYSGPENPNATRFERGQPDIPSRTYIAYFEIAWDDGHLKEFQRPPVMVTVLGNTKELVRLQLADRSFLRRPPLLVPNQAEFGLVTNTDSFVPAVPATNQAITPGPWRVPRWAPKPDFTPDQLQEWMAKFLGGTNVVQTLADPEQVKVYRLKEFDDLMKVRNNLEDYPAKRRPSSAKLAPAKLLGEKIASTSSYDWRLRAFMPNFKYRLQFIRDTNVVDVIIAPEESTLRVYSASRRTLEINYQPAAAEITKLIKKL